MEVEKEGKAGLYLDRALAFVVDKTTFWKNQGYNPLVYPWSSNDLWVRDVLEWLFGLWHDCVAWYVPGSQWVLAAASAGWWLAGVKQKKQRVFGAGQAKQYKYSSAVGSSKSLYALFLKYLVQEKGMRPFSIWQHLFPVLLLEQDWDLMPHLAIMWNLWDP